MPLHGVKRGHHLHVLMDVPCSELTETAFRDIETSLLLQKRSFHIVNLNSETLGGGEGAHIWCCHLLEGDIQGGILCVPFA